MLRKCFLLILSVFCALLSSCVTQDVPDDTRRGNFEALWRTLDEHYCFFGYKHEAYGLDWNKVREKYKPAIAELMTDKQLFEVLAEMTYELRDGHVNLYAAHNTARYGKWYDDYPMNQSDSLERRYLGTAQEFQQAAGLKYRVLDDNVGYVRCASFELLFGDGNLQEMMRTLSTCDALIIDVRSNGGGLLTAANKLASLLINESTIGAYMSHKTGTGHDDFSAPEPITIDPFKGLRWQKPVAILTNRRTYSAANSFVMYTKGLPHVTVVGDRTGGGAGMPFSSELPNGWSIRFSACPMYDRQMQPTEMGIDPDVKVDITSDDYARSVDTIIETARRLLKQQVQRGETNEAADATGHVAEQAYEALH